MSAAIRARRAGQVLASGAKAAAPASFGAARLDVGEIVIRLEQAGATLLALPSQGYTTQLRRMRFEIVHTALEAYGWEAPALRAPVPSAAAISRMDEAYSWLALIPEESFLLRRILNARSLVHPLTGRHLYPWRRLATTVGADHKSVQRWHANGICIVQRRLNAGSTCV